MTGGLRRRSPAPAACAMAAFVVCVAWAGGAMADSYVVPAAIDFSVRDTGLDGFDEVLEGECCIRATRTQTSRIRGVAEFGLSSLPAGLQITSVKLRLVPVSTTGGANPADFFAFAGDGDATVEDAERTDVLLAAAWQVLSIGSPVDFSHPSLLSLVQTANGQGSHVGMMFRLSLENEPVFRDLEFAANTGNPNLPRLLIEADPAPPPPPEVSPPGAAVPFIVERPGPGMLSLGWEDTAGADTYRVVSGDLAGLMPGSGVTAVSAAPMMCGVGGTTTMIPEPVGDVYLLVAGENPGGVGPLGSGATGPRAADPACP